MKLFCIFCLLFCSLSTFGQQPAHSIFWEKQFEGVDIYQIIQDLEYNYWFATDQGIYKHDGYSFKKIECPEMKGESVFNFIMNSQGVIYCLNLNQQVFQIKQDVCSVIFNFPHASPDNFIVLNFKDELILSDSKWFYVLNSNNSLIQTFKSDYNHSISAPFLLSTGEIVTHCQGTEYMYIYSKGAFECKKVKLNAPKEINSLDALKFYQSSTTCYAIERHSRRVFKFDINTLELTFIQEFDQTPSSEGTRYYQIGDLLWMASNISGVSVMNGSLKSHFLEDKLFKNYFISFVYQDREGNILLSTFDQGVIVMPDINVPDVKAELDTYNITRFYAEKNGNLYLGTGKGQIIRYDSEFKLLPLTGDKRIETLFKVSSEDIFVCDGIGGCAVYDFKTKKTVKSTIGSLKDFIELGQNEYIAGLNIGLYKVHIDQDRFIVRDRKYYAERIYRISKEKSTNSIYVSSSKGVSYLNPDTGASTRLLFDNQVIQAIYFQTVGDQTYISTRSKGVLIYSGGKFIRRFIPLSNNTQLHFYKFIVHNDRIYANTQNGLIAFNLRGKIVRYIDRSVGLSANKIIDFEIHKNQLWLAHSRGVQTFDLKNIQSSIQPPKLILERIEVNGEYLPYSSGDKFGSSDKKFRFVFKVPTLKYRDNIIYHFKLEGVSNEWSTQTYENHDVTYNSLAPGKYRFIIKVESNGFFSKPIYYSFSISAPFYQQWWFILSIVIFALLIISLIYKRKLAIQARKAKHINELNASRLTAIQSQMNPHFIFNSLNSIQDLVLRGDIDNSYGFITKFSHLVRRTLNYSNKDFIEFEQEVKLIELYLSLEKLRFKEDLSYTIETGDVDGILIPPMLIQPFIENALVHGLLHKKGEKKLSIRFYLDGSLFCEVIDNGIGRDRAKEIKKRQRSTHESFSVNAIKQRFEILEAHFKDELGFTYYDLMENGEPVGTKVVLKLPTNYRF